MSELKLGAIEKGLVKHQVFTEKEIEHHSLKAKAQNTDIIEYIQKNKILKDDVLAEFLTKQFAFPLIDLDRDFDPHAMPRNLIDDKIVEQGRVLPIQSDEQGVVTIAVSNPSGMRIADNIRSTSNFKLNIVIAEHGKMNDLIDQYFRSLKLNRQSEEELLGDILRGGTDVVTNNTSVLDLNDGDETAIVTLVNRILNDAIQSKASDLHFEPFQNVYRVRFRIDGILKIVRTYPPETAQRLTARLKVISAMDISERRVPQDGRIRLKVTKTKSIDFRVSSLPTMYGEKMVLRILDSTSATLGIDALGFEPDQKEMYLKALHRPQGMILITGQTGSGKTVSLYTGLNILNTPDCNISTAEEPVEIDLEGINQVNVSNKTGFTFAKALKAFLRQDPDVIMVGEIRDLETAEISIKASQTGHMVLSTLHTNSAPETLTRLKNMGVPAYNVATSVSLVIAQRLARRLCARCKIIDDTFTHKALLDFGFTEEQLSDPDSKIYKAVGCSSCNDGYKGRVGVYEVMEISSELSKIIMDDGNSLQIEEQAKKEGFRDLRTSGRMKILQGVTTINEINRITTD